jgi:transcriptional regulator with XRE-family HTH domain
MINLKDYRKEVMHLTQKEVANLCNVSVKTIERWESDKYQHKPNKVALRKLAGLYNIRVESLKNTIKGITMEYTDVCKKVTKLDHILDELTALKDDLYRSSQRNEDRIDWLIEQCLKAKYDIKEEE